MLVIGGGITGTGVALDCRIAGCARRWSSATTSHPAHRRRARSWCTVDCAICRQGEIRLVYEALRERERLRKNAPHLVKVLPFMIPILTKDGVVSRKIARAMGSAMWMYDLTGGLRIGKLHRRLKKDAAFAHLPTMPKERLASAYLYFDATVDDARLCLTVARTAADRARSSSIAAGWSSRRRPTTGTRPAPSSTPTADDHGRRQGRRQRRRRVVRRGSHPRRGCRSRFDSSRQGRAHHAAVGEGAQRHRGRHPRAEGQAQPVRRAVGAVGDGTFEHVYVGTTDTDYRRLDRRPAVHEGRHRLRAQGAQPLVDHAPGSPRPTSPACGPGCGRS